MNLPAIPPKTLDRLIQRGKALWEDFELEAGSRHHLFVPCDHREVYAALRPLAQRAATFLEFGSAAGVVTIMADLLGMEAFGIEIEPALVPRSQHLAAEFDSEATFVEGSFVPFDYRDEIENLESDRITPTEGDDGYDEIGMQLDEFDLVFAYPWPGEEDWLFELMRRHARRDALLLTFDGKDGCRFETVARL
ncbi:MAG: hypothetical protein KDE27_14255 [Planctomycetes bacterium]|nr:hypothetical protein [Planctomycetota bacterium]